jgi:hypothetical protein
MVHVVFIWNVEWLPPAQIPLRQVHLFMTHCSHQHQHVTCASNHLSQTARLFRQSEMLTCSEPKATVCNSFSFRPGHVLILEVLAAVFQLETG